MEVRLTQFSILSCFGCTDAKHIQHCTRISGPSFFEVMSSLASVFHIAIYFFNALTVSQLHNIPSNSC